MRGKKAIQVVFDNYVALEDARKHAGRRRHETDEYLILMLQELCDRRKMWFQNCNHLLDSFDSSHLQLICCTRFRLTVRTIAEITPPIRRQSVGRPMGRTKVRLGLT